MQYICCMLSYASYALCDCSYIRNVMIIVCSPDIPVFPTVTAVITLERYEEVKTETHKFLVPRDYHKVSHHCVCVCARACVGVCERFSVYVLYYAIGVYVLVSELLFYSQYIIVLLLEMFTLVQVVPKRREQQPHQSSSVSTENTHTSQSNSH